MTFSVWQDVLIQERATGTTMEVRITMFLIAGVKDQLFGSADGSCLFAGKGGNTHDWRRRLCRNSVLDCSC